MSLTLSSLSQLVNDLYLPAIREQEASIYEGVFFNRPDVARHIRAMSDEDFMAYFKAAHPLPGEVY